MLILTMELREVSAALYKEGEFGSCAEYHSHDIADYLKTVNNVPEGYDLGKLKGGWGWRTYEFKKRGGAAASNVTGGALIDVVAVKLVPDHFQG